MTLWNSKSQRKYIYFEQIFCQSTFMLTERCNGRLAFPVHWIIVQTSRFNLGWNIVDFCGRWSSLFTHNLTKYPIVSDTCKAGWGSFVIVCLVCTQDSWPRSHLFFCEGLTGNSFMLTSFLANSHLMESLKSLTSRYKCWPRSNILYSGVNNFFEIVSGLLVRFTDLWSWFYLSKYIRNTKGGYREFLFKIQTIF